ncbi:MAG TPA: Holliday junction branch migration protein RuvA [Fibrobacteraceae bacterium]|nr:Holliday junction branch migration protein RuvA [Fibrobacteraceae bacterium]
MIERLHGILVERHPTFAVVECGGVGYGVNLSARTGETLPAEGAEVSLLTWLQVREDAMQLFGFGSSQEKELFLHMIDISGVGPKMAQRILSSVSPTDFLGLVAREDLRGLSKIKGIGKKTAELLILGLKDQAMQLSAVQGGDASAFLPAGLQEAILALHSLGVKEPAARQAVEKAADTLGPDASSSALIPEALRLL